MPSRRNPIHEAVMHAERTIGDIGRELRVARLTSGRSQARVAAAMGTSQAWVSMSERGRLPALTVQDLARHAAAVGLRTWIKVFPDGRVTLDDPQLQLLGRLHPRIHARSLWELEVPMPDPRDLRAADCRITNADSTVMVEAITRFVDAQAQNRAAQRKRRDLGCDRLILLLADTSANRRALREAGPGFLAAFPVGPRAALRALGEGHDPGGDAVIVL
jgi:transcriptional regulator with XRE-family HTH domain